MVSAVPKMALVENLSNSPFETELLFLLSRSVFLEFRLQLFDGGEIPPQV
jgi:hypothetical protein